MNLKKSKVKNMNLKHLKGWKYELKIAQKLKTWIKYISKVENTN